MKHCRQRCLKITPLTVCRLKRREYIGKIVTSVTASRAAIDFAVEQKRRFAFGTSRYVTEKRVADRYWLEKERIAALLRHDINMAGYHLPLDAHPTLGNNAQLADRLGFATEKRFGEQNLLNSGSLKQAKTLGALAAHIETVLQRKPVVIGKPEREIRRVAWCSGGAQGFFQTAIDEGVDLYLTGEISEAQYHLANETGTAFISAGHHATERYGVRALAESAAEVFGLEVCHFDENNPA